MRTTSSRFYLSFQIIKSTHSVFYMRSLIAAAAAAAAAAVAVPVSRAETRLAHGSPDLSSNRRGVSAASYACIPQFGEKASHRFLSA